MTLYELLGIAGLEDVLRTVAEGGAPLCPICGEKTTVTSKVPPDELFPELSGEERKFWQVECSVCHFPTKQIHEQFNEREAPKWGRLFLEKLKHKNQIGGEIAHE